MNISKVRKLASFNMGFHWFAIGVVIPVMTLTLQEKGFSLAQVGLYFAVYSGATVLFELPTGGLADSIGRKKVYLISLLFLIGGAVFFLFAHSFYTVLVCAVFQGIARSLSSGTMDAHFIDEFYRADKNVNLQEEMAKIETSIPVGLGLGSLLGGYIPMTLGHWTEVSLFHSRYISNYIVFFILVVLQFIFTWSLVHEPPRKDKDLGIINGFTKVPEVIGTSMKYGIGHPVILMILLATFVWGFSISGLEQFWQPQVKSIVNPGTGSWIYGFLSTGYFMAAAAGSLAAIPLCRLFKNNYVLVLFLSRALMGLLYFALAVQIHIIPFAFFYITLFLFNGVQSSPESSIFNGEIPSEKRSTLLSFSSLFLQIGGIAGSIVLGFTAGRYSIPKAWAIASIAIAASALLYLLIPLFKGKKEKGIAANEF